MTITPALLLLIKLNSLVWFIMWGVQYEINLMEKDNA